MPADDLTSADKGRWLHVQVAFPHWDASGQAMAHAVGPMLDEVAEDWWFMRKYPCWRIRVHDATPGAVEGILGKAEADGLISGWQPGIYEPEEYAFGGLAGIDIAHQLFCADSRAVLDYLRRDAPQVPKREVSLLLVGAILNAAGLDSFERGDVYSRIAALRPSPPDAADRMARLTGQVRTLLSVSPAPTLHAMFAAPWLAAFENAGRSLAQAAGEGRLERGPRAILAHVVIFHWNRLALDATTQGILARAARAVYLPAE
jgi:thiopeptide-type bacteriocin biosynthesis protein